MWSKLIISGVIFLVISSSSALAYWMFTEKKMRESVQKEFQNKTPNQYGKTEEDILQQHYTNRPVPNNN